MYSPSFAAAARPTYTQPSHLLSPYIYLPTYLPTDSSSLPQHNLLPELLQAKGEMDRQNAVFRQLLTVALATMADKHLGEKEAKALMQVGR